MLVIYFRQLSFPPQDYKANQRAVGMLLRLATSNGEAGQITHWILEDFPYDILKYGQNVLCVIVDPFTILRIIFRQAFPFAGLFAYQGSDFIDLLTFESMYAEFPKQRTSMRDEQVFGNDAARTMGNRLMDGWIRVKELSAEFQIPFSLTRKKRSSSRWQGLVDTLAGTKVTQ